MNRSFIDKYAMRGRPRLMPDSEMSLKSEPQSRSLRDLSKFDAESRVIHAEIKRGILRLDLQHAIGDKLVIKKKDAINFANWILKTYQKGK